jgi:hypothetical protein
VDDGAVLEEMKGKLSTYSCGCPRLRLNSQCHVKDLSNLLEEGGTGSAVPGVPEKVR